jgi:DNA-binding response OmpR family regulator
MDTAIPKVLMVEDDLNLGILLVDMLENGGYDVKLCKDGISAMRTLKKRTFDVCILDVSMPGPDGFALSQHLRKNYQGLPFLFLTARSGKEDKMRGYKLGAEDYLTKPFDEDELLCKLEVILRRKKSEQKRDLPTQFEIGSFSFDYDLRALRHNRSSRRLTEKENEILWLLCLNKNKILRREEAVEQVYGKRDYFLGRSFDVFISRIRKYLQPDPGIVIENVFKVGFILKVPEGSNPAES